MPVPSITVASGPAELRIVSRLPTETVSFRTPGPTMIVLPGGATLCAA